jgi:hypothetical protein
VAGKKRAGSRREQKATSIRFGAKQLAWLQRKAREESRALGRPITMAEHVRRRIDRDMADEEMRARVAEEREARAALEEGTK